MKKEIRKKTGCGNAQKKSAPVFGFLTEKFLPYIYVVYIG